MPSIKTELDKHVSDTVGTANYTVSVNGSATFGAGANLTMDQLDRVLRVAAVNNYDVKLVAGVLTLQRR